jgi:hypothetical protein
MDQWDVKRSWYYRLKERSNDYVDTSKMGT